MRRSATQPRSRKCHLGQEASHIDKAHRSLRGYSPEMGQFSLCRAQSQAGYTWEVLTLRAMMYDMVAKVVRPARISV